MDFERGSLLLLSLACVPACVSRTASGDDAGDGEPPRELGDGCVAFYDRYLACYEELYGTSDYDDSGYDTEGYEPGQYCESMLDYVAQSYGEDCARAQDDIFACLAALDCEAYSVDDALEQCPEQVDRAQKTCPELFPPCDCIHSASSTGSCELDCSVCEDGNSYGLECRPGANTDAPHSCTCTVNGMVTETFEAAAACTDINELVRDRCGAP